MACVVISTVQWLLEQNKSVHDIPPQFTRYNMYNYLLFRKVYCIDTMFKMYIGHDLIQDLWMWKL